MLESGKRTSNTLIECDLTYIVSFGCVSFIVIRNNNNICLSNNVYSCDSASLSFHVDIYVVVIV